MAIAFDSAVETLYAGTSSPFSWNHTCTGSDLVLLASFSSNSSTTITSVTYNSVAMTQIGSSTAFGTNLIWLYYLVAPSTGTNSVTITFNGGTGQIVYTGSASYTGCKQDSGVIDSSALSTDGTSPFDATLTSTADNCWHTGFWVSQGALSDTAGTATTERAQTPGDNAAWGDNNGAITPAGSNTIQWTGSGNTGMAHVTIAPPGGGGGGATAVASTLPFLGAG